MNGSTALVVLGLIVATLTTAGICLLLSVPLVDDTPPASTTTHAVAHQPTLLPARDRAMP